MKTLVSWVEFGASDLYFSISDGLGKCSLEPQRGKVVLQRHIAPDGYLMLQIGIWVFRMGILGS